MKYTLFIENINSLPLVFSIQAKITSKMDKTKGICMKNKILPHQHSNIKEIKKLSDQLTKINEFQIISDVFKQLGDTTRLRIFWLLCHCKECVTNIASILDMTSPAVCHHLRILKNCGLIVSSRSGKEVYYSASNNKQSQLMHKIIEQVMEIICPK